MPRKSTRNESQTVTCPSKMRQVNLRLPLEAYELLQQYAPTRKSWGTTVAQLLYEERARKEERALCALRSANDRQN